MADPSSVISVETKRLELENHVKKLWASLREWQQWELEYASMIEDIQEADSFSTQVDVSKFEDEDDADPAIFGQKRLTTRERRLLLYRPDNTPRTLADASSIISRRVDYVQQNIKSLHKLIQAAQETITSNYLTVEEKQQFNERLPVSDVVEELDEDDNVLSGKVTEAKDKAPLVVDLLEKVGLVDAPQADSKNPVKHQQLASTAITSKEPEAVAQLPPQPKVTPSLDPAAASITHTKHQQPPSFEAARSTIPTTGIEHSLPTRSKKRVSFANDTKNVEEVVDHPQSWSAEEKQTVLCKFCTVMSRTAPIIDRVLTRDAPPSTSFASQRIQVVEALLRLPQNQKVRRLLRSYGLTLWQGANLLLELSQGSNFDLDHPQLAPLLTRFRQLPERNGTLARKHLPGSHVEEEQREIATEHVPTSNSGESAPLINAEVKELKPENFNADSSLLPVEPIIDPVIPLNESTAETELRRDMLQYNALEVGHVVAEMDLDEFDELDDFDEQDIGLEDDYVNIQGHGTDNFDGDYADIYDDEEYDTFVDRGEDEEVEGEMDDEDDEDEDAYGRSTIQMLPQDYINRMHEIEARHKQDVSGSPTLETNPASNALLPTSGNHGSRNDRPQTKGQAFVPTSILKPSSSNHIATQSIGNKFPATSVPLTQATAKKPPINQMDILERPYNPVAKVAEPNELDPALLQRQMSDQYHRLRNRMIERQGGFLRSEEQAEMTVEQVAEAESGKKMSRFKAARLGLT